MDKQHFHRISVLDGNANCEVVAGADDIADAADSKSTQLSGPF